jgi:hypothetical protein
MKIFNILYFLNFTTTMIMRLLLVVLLCGLSLSSTVAFAPVLVAARTGTGSISRSSTHLSAKKGKSPSYDRATERWTKGQDDDGAYPYDAVGALLRHGPGPFIGRLTNPDDYEQNVLKYMANGDVSRSEAVGNMDAKLNNAMDWMYQKTAEKNGAPKVDYTAMNKKDAAKSVIWALFIVPLAVNVIIQTVTQF